MSRQLTSQFHKSKTLEGKYMLGDEIGKGAYGRVYKGLDLENGDFVAIKQFSLENIAQEDLNIIMQEIDLLKNLNHRNIVKYFGSLKTKTHLHIILEYVENGSLAGIVKPTKFGPFPESLVAVYIAQVLEGLVYLHEQGVIHRDIKGANILTTKEGLVKLADFGVATKLNEADVNTHSVVGTPYWMAPEVIEMSGVCAASDIWSVGCTVIELLTCVPPYYDLQPMPALFRIVQDEHPPLPDSLSSDITDFLHQCFKKDARQRPDAKTLLTHPWILNCRRALQSSIRRSGTIGGLQNISENAEFSEGDNQRIGGKLHVENEKVGKDLPKVTGVRKTNGDPPLNNEDAEDKKRLNKNNLSDQVPISAIHQNINESGVVSANKSCAASCSTGLQEQGHSAESVEQLKQDAKTMGANDLSKSSDTEKNTSLDDLFHPLNKNIGAQASNASTSESKCHEKSTKARVNGTGRSNGAAKLKVTVSQKRVDDKMQESSSRGNLVRLMMGSDDVIDIDTLVFDEKLPGENLYPLQAVEFSRSVGSLRPEEPEDVIVSACQKIISIFNRRPEQKIIFVRKHGFLPLVDLLEVPKTRVISSVLQIVNHIIKDNTEFQENACLVGLIPMVISFAGSDCPLEVRMEAAYFLQHLCQSSSLTLQMFIACRGIPVLVGFLEADYTKYRGMVHLAIDGMWEVFKLQQATPRNDFCRIAAKNGILLRLINTIHNLNEATQIATILAGGGLPIDDTAQQQHSALESGHPIPFPGDTQVLAADRPNNITSRYVLRPQRSNGSQVDSPHHSIHATPEPVHSEGDINEQRVSNAGNRNSVDRPSKSMENGFPTSLQEQGRPRLNVLEKEPPARQFSGLERQESIKSRLSASNEKKTNDELDLLMEEFTEVSGHGKENGNLDSRFSPKELHKKAGLLISNEGGTSVSRIASQRVSGAQSESSVLTARHASARSSGLLSRMVSTLNEDMSREYLGKVADLLLEFAKADTTVKSYMCSQSLLIRLFQMFHKIEPPILLKILMCINRLSRDPNCLENLQRADAINYLIPNLELKEGHLISQIHSEVLRTLFNLCKINKRRQEQAAENGIIPHLMNFITSNSPLKQYALPLLCDMAHASRYSREQLRAHGGLDVYLSLLDDELWAVTALDSIAVCLAHDNDSQKVEQALLKKDAIYKLVTFFESCPEQHFLHILEPFLKIITKSSRINTTLALNGLTPLLIARLDNQDAIARLNLLKIIKAVYEHHPRPKQLIVENDLPQKLQNLIEERRDGQSSGGQVLVKQMATSLLKALHINTVL